MKKGIIGLLCGIILVAVIVVVTMLATKSKEETIEDKYDALLSTEIQLPETTAPLTPYDETDPWTVPTGPTDFDLPEGGPEERVMAEGERVFNISTDVFDFNIGENTLLDYDAFINDAYVQQNISEFFFDREKVFIPETYTYKDGLMKVQVPEDSTDSETWLVIDVLEGTMKFEYIALSTVEQETTTVAQNNVYSEIYENLDTVDSQLIMDVASGKLSIETPDGHSDGVISEGVIKYHWTEFDTQMPVSKWSAVGYDETDALILSHPDLGEAYIPDYIVSLSLSYSDEAANNILTYIVHHVSVRSKYISDESLRDRLILTVEDHRGKQHTLVYLEADPENIYIIKK